MSLFNRYLSDGIGAGDSAPPEGEAPAESTTPPGGEQEEAQEASAEGQEPSADDQRQNLEDLPEWVRNLVKDLRSENAAHRTAKKDAEKAAQAAARKAAEEQGKFKELYEQELARREAAEAEARRLELDALKSRVATEVGLPPQLASRLQGETEDELRADAQEVLAALPRPALDNDASRGTGASGRAPQMSDAEIQEFAARMGVDPKYVKPEFFRVARK